MIFAQLCDYITILNCTLQKDEFYGMWIMSQFKNSVPEGKAGKNAKFSWKFHGGHFPLPSSSPLEHILLNFSKFQVFGSKHD